MTILQLNPHICVDTPLGPGVALFIIDYAVHTNTCWVVAIEKLDWTIKHFDANDVKFIRIGHTISALWDLAAVKSV